MSPATRSPGAASASSSRARSPRPTAAPWRSSRAPSEARSSRSRCRSRRLRLDGAQTLDAEILRELPRARRDARAQLGRLEHARLATLRQDLALEPLVAPDRDLAQGAPVREAPRSSLDLVAGDLGRVEHARATGAAQSCQLKALARLEPLLLELRAPHAVQAERALAVARAVVGVHVPVRQRALEGVGLDEPRRRLCVDLLLVFDLDETLLVARAGERRDQVLFGAAVRLGPVRELEHPERVLELLAHLVEGGVRICRDHRPDVLQR